MTMVETSRVTKKRYGISITPPCQIEAKDWRKRAMKTSALVRPSRVCIVYIYILYTSGYTYEIPKWTFLVFRKARVYIYIFYIFFIALRKYITHTHTHIQWRSLISSWLSFRRQYTYRGRFKYRADINCVSFAVFYTKKKKYIFTIMVNWFFNRFKWTTTWEMGFPAGTPAAVKTVTTLI